MFLDHSLFSLQPDGVQRGLVGEVIKRFEQRGYKLVGLKMLNVERSLAEKHYADLSEKPFFGALVDYICSGPVVAMVGSCLIPISAAEAAAESAATVLMLGTLLRGVACRV
jgi:nucleoside diphosphate kinase